MISAVDGSLKSERVSMGKAKTNSKQKIHHTFGNQPTVYNMSYRLEPVQVKSDRSNGSHQKL